MVFIFILRNNILHIKKLALFLGLLALNCNRPQKKGSEATEETSSSDIEITSSNIELVETFNWAKEKARSFVQTGKKGPIGISERNSESEEFAYIPSYWAGYPGRSAFYSRDFCHQVEGAHLLGLKAENFTMMKAFAASASEDKKWFPIWAINFDGSPYTLDYRGDDNFVREVPAVFELVEKAYSLYQWTGDRRYLNDEVLWEYYTKAVTDFITLHDDRIPNGVAEGTGKGIFDGAASYNEQQNQPLVEAGDAIASQYRAFIAYAQMAKAKGEIGLFNEFEKKAADLKMYFNTDWGIKNTETYNRGYLQNGESVAGWGKENSWFLPMKGLTEAGSDRTLKYLEFIDERLDSKDDIPDNIEALSYIPEVFFLYHKNELGWKWMKHIIANLKQGHTTADLTGKNGDYPEVSYVLVRNVVQDLLGISPNSAENSIATLSHLPDEIENLGVDNIKIGNSSVAVKHDAKHTSKLHFKTGVGTLNWQAGFSGSHDYLYVNGVKKPCNQGVDYGLPYSWCTIELTKGDEAIVSTIP